MLVVDGLAQNVRILLLQMTTAVTVIHPHVQPIQYSTHSYICSSPILNCMIHLVLSDTAAVIFESWYSYLKTAACLQ